MKLETIQLPEVWDPSDDRLHQQKAEHLRLYGRLKQELREMAKQWVLGWTLYEEEEFQELAATVWMLASYYRWSVTMILEEGMEDETDAWWVGETVKLVRRNGRFDFERVEFPRL